MSQMRTRRYLEKQSNKTQGSSEMALQTFDLNVGG